MAAKITAFVLTLVTNIAGGVAIFVMMLVVMNGFSGSDAEWGLGAYIILAVIVSVLMGGGAALLVYFLQKKQVSAVVSAFIAVPAFSVIGIGLEVVCSVAGIAIADYVRVNY